jgi:hypothetical protein
VSFPGATQTETLDAGDAQIDAPASSPPQTHQTNFADADDGTEEVVWHGGVGYDKPEAEGEPEKDEDADLFDELFPTTPTQQQGQQRQQQTYQTEYQQGPVAEGMPPDFDEKLLDEREVQTIEGQLKLHFQAKLIAPVSTDPQVQAAYQASVDDAYRATVAALKMKAKYSQIVQLAKGLYDQNKNLSAQFEPFRRVQAAKMVAEKFNVADYRKLLKNPRTGNPVTSPDVMIELAAMIGEGDRKQRVSARQGVDRPTSPSQGRGRQVSIANIDPDSKEFEEIERQVAAGKHVRLLA